MLCWLIVQNNNEMEATEYEILEDENIPLDIRNKVKKRLVLRHFFNEYELPNPSLPESWHNFLYPAKKIEGKASHYYSYICEPLTESKLDLNKIIPFNKYRNNIKINI